MVVCVKFSLGRTLMIASVSMIDFSSASVLSKITFGTQILDHSDSVRRFRFSSLFKLWNVKPGSVHLARRTYLMNMMPPISSRLRIAFKTTDS